MKKILVIALAVCSLIFATSCATTQATNAAYVTNVNMDVSDLVLGEKVEVRDKFSDKEVSNGYATQVLTAKALKGTNYDFIFMPRIEKTGSTVTLSGRPARLK